MILQWAGVIYLPRNAWRRTARSMIPCLLSSSNTFATRKNGLATFVQIIRDLIPFLQQCEDIVGDPHRLRVKARAVRRERRLQWQYQPPPAPAGEVNLRHLPQTPRRLQHKALSRPALAMAPVGRFLRASLISARRPAVALNPAAPGRDLRHSRLRLRPMWTFHWKQP